MAASETRQGPGWWMDPQGGWNPPENWPESTPPLPGWIRGSNGLWSSPDMITPAPVADASTLNLSPGRSEPLIDLRDASPTNQRPAAEGAPRHKDGWARPSSRTGYSPAHARSGSGFQATRTGPGPHNPPSRQAAGQLGLQYATPSKITPIEDEPIISRSLKVGFALSIAAIGAVVAGLVILVMLL